MLNYDKFKLILDHDTLTLAVFLQVDKVTAMTAYRSSTENNSNSKPSNPLPATPATPGKRLKDQI